MKAIFVEQSAEFWVKLAARLKESLGIDAAYWLGLKRFEHDVRALFPECTFHDSIDATRGDPAPGWPDAHVPCWDRGMSTVWTRDMHAILLMMDRIDVAGTFSYRERLRYLVHQLSYWTMVLDRIEPDIVIFSCAPHVVYDYILYCLCKARDIPIAVYEWCYFGPHAFIMPGFEDGDPELAKAYAHKLREAGDRPARLSESARQYVSAIRDAKTGGVNVHIPQLEQRFFASNPYRGAAQAVESQRRVQRRFWHDLKDIRARWRAQLGSYRTQFDLLRNGVMVKWGKAEQKRWESAFFVERNRRFEQSMIGAFLQLRIYRQQQRWLPTALDRRKAYEALVQPMDLSLKFVALPLHFQPERSTSPQGDLFGDQIKFVQMIAASTPDDWRVYVKEHLSEFNPGAYGHMYRPPGYYETLSQIPKVRLVAADISPFDMIDHAQAVATVAGNMGWEALLRGCPALVAGAAWYIACEGVFRVRDRASCIEALRKIEAGYQVDRQKVDLFLETVEEVSPIAVPQAPFDSYTTLTLDENVQVLADMTARFISLHVPSRSTAA